MNYVDLIAELDNFELYRSGAGYTIRCKTCGDRWHDLPALGQIVDLAHGHFMGRHDD